MGQALARLPFWHIFKSADFQHSQAGVDSIVLPLRQVSDGIVSVISQKEHRMACCKSKMSCKSDKPAKAAKKPVAKKTAK